MRVELSSDGGPCRLGVADTGAGIAPADQATIFEAFRQASGGRRAGGHRARADARPPARRGPRRPIDARVRGRPRQPVQRRAAARASCRGDARRRPRPSAPRAASARPRDRGRPLRRANSCGSTSRRPGSRRRSPPTAAPGIEWATDAATRRRSSSTSCCPTSTAGRSSSGSRARRRPATSRSSSCRCVDDAPLGIALGAVDYFVKPVAREALLGVARPADVHDARSGRAP